MHLSHDETTEDPGDDSVVTRVYLAWVPSTEIALATVAKPNGEVDTAAPPLGHIARDENGAWRLAFAVQRGPKRRQRHFALVNPFAFVPGAIARNDRWPLLKLAPGVWDVAKSIHVAGQFHGFVTLVGVPDPAPWEAK